MRRNTEQRKKRLQLKLLQRRQMWTLTLEGWVIALALTISLFLFAVTHIQSFLAVTSPVKADILVVEGWMDDNGLKQALAEFKRGSYRQIITTGIPLQRGYYLSEYKNFANLAAATLEAMGADKNQITPIPTPGVLKDRTYASVLELRKWLMNSQQSGQKIESINLFSDNVHSRRSWMIYKKLLEPKIKVGVISAENFGYNPQRWWSSSEGVRTVLPEAIGYIYALLKSN
jgi:hypothetical protein